jgi:hypothetical protein
MEKNFFQAVGRIIFVEQFLFSGVTKRGNVHVNLHFVIGGLLPIVLGMAQGATTKDKPNENS